MMWSDWLVDDIIYKKIFSNEVMKLTTHVSVMLPIPIL